MPPEDTFIPGTDIRIRIPDESGSAPPLKLVGGKPDKELADEIRAKVEAAITPMLSIFTEAKAKGFEVSYMIQMDGLGRAYLHSLKIMKEY